MQYFPILQSHCFTYENRNKEQQVVRLPLTIYSVTEFGGNDNMTSTPLSRTFAHLKQSNEPYIHCLQNLAFYCQATNIRNRNLKSTFKKQTIEVPILEISSALGQNWHAYTDLMKFNYNNKQYCFSQLIRKSPITSQPTTR